MAISGCHAGQGARATGLVAIVATALVLPAEAKQNIRDAFFSVYSDAMGTTIETVPSHAQHCGVCHFSFSGGGPRNPYGQLLESELANWPNNPNGRQQAVMAIAGNDPDNDGFSTDQEVLDVDNFSNTPTFPGLTPANVASVQDVDIEDIAAHLVPSAGGDVTGPEVEVTAPAEGIVLTANEAFAVEWTATDPSGVAAVEIQLSLDDGATFVPVAVGLPNSGSHTWYPANRPSGLSVLRVVAVDNAFNEGSDDSDPFSIVSPPGGLVPTTLRDFDQPGSQPFEAGILNPPEGCVCHGGYDEAVEPMFNWQGSMMAHASRDPLFEALMVISNQDAPDSGDLCLRCHIPRGWLQGRSIPTDGSQMLEMDKSGVACDLCHRLVDPIYDPAENPVEDAAILADLTNPASTFGNGMYTVDPTGARRGPFVDAVTGHPILVSPFHREAAICGTCHNVSNPAFVPDGEGNYVPNELDAPADSFLPQHLMPVERTYSEWFYSDYNSPEGVYAPQFGGNRDFVATCQDCHMRDVTGMGCSFGPVREDLPLHDMTGGATWIPSLLPALYPDAVDADAIAAGIERATYMLQNAAELSALQEGVQLAVTVVNNTGHKLPTGYPEGRRMWINVKFFDDAMELVGEVAAYDPLTGVLDTGGQAIIYEAKPGMDETVAPLAGVDPGPSFHFVLNNKIFKDNRIPPRGFSNADYAVFGGAPVEHVYSDGQYWDDSFYDIPSGAGYAEVTLYYQSTTKEFIEFLRDENTTNDAGQLMYDLWDQNDKAPPVAMAMVTVPLETGPSCPADLDGSGAVDVDDLIALILAWGPCASPEDCPADLDGNETVDVDDLVALILAWGPCE